MAYKNVSAGAGASWFGQGWSLFTQSAGLWIVMALLFGIIYLVLSFIPLIGGLAAALLGPALFGGLIYGARELDQDRSLEIGHLFQAFRESGRAGPMILLGLVPLAAGIVMAVLTGMLVAGAVGTGAAAGSRDAALGVLAGGGLTLMALGVILGIVVGALMLFAIPRVMFNAASPATAVKESLQASIGNIGAFIVFAIVYLLLSIVAAIPLGLGFLILIPVMAGAVYAANKEVFGEEGEAAATASAGSAPAA